MRKVTVIGVGGAGGRIAGRLAEGGEDAPDTLAVDTDSCALAACGAAALLALGERQTGGFGTGGDDEKGRAAAEDGDELFLERLGDAEVAVFVAGLGGGMGSGALPQLAALARGAGGRLSFCFVALPLGVEGAQRRALASRALERLRDACDLLVVLPNDLLCAEAAGRDLQSVFEAADVAFADAVRALWRTLCRPGCLRALDPAEMAAAGRGAGGFACAVATASGATRASDAAQALLRLPALEEGRVLQRAKRVLLGIIGGPDLTLGDIESVMRGVRGALRSECRLWMGTAADEGSTGTLTLLVMAADKPARAPEEAGPAPQRTAPGVEPPPLQPASAGRRGAKAAVRQATLALETVGRGRFKDVAPTYFEGEDLDVPTFRRRNIRLER